MSLVSSNSPNIPGASTNHEDSKDLLQILWKHRQHVFIFTRAGKPIFSVHGGEERLSPLFALFQVLLHMGGDQEGGEVFSTNNNTSFNRSQPPPQRQQQTARQTPSFARDAGATASFFTSSSPSDGVHQVIYYQPCPNAASSDGGHEVQALTLFFYTRGELMYVMAHRTAAPTVAAAAAGGATHNGMCGFDESARFASTAPPVASYCAAQLRHLHHFILLVLPTINSLLVQQPSLDVMPVFTDGDRRALRELIESYTLRLPYAVGAMATLTLSVEKRRIVEASLLRSFRSADNDVSSAAIGSPAHQLFSFVFYHDYLVAAVGPPETYATPSTEADRVAPVALGSPEACCGGLHVDDALLLYRYTRSLVRRQTGEAWVPVCLPRFNSTGYLWCYAVNFSRLIRELRSERGLSVWPDLWVASSEQDVLLIHVSAAQDDFAPLARCTRRFAQQLYAPVVGDNFYYRLEEEMCYRTPAPLTELLGPLHTSRGNSNNSGTSAATTHDHLTFTASPLPPPLPSLVSRPAGVPLWYGLVLQGSDPTFLTSDEVAEPCAATEAAAAAVAAMQALPTATADIRLFFESQPSPLLNLTTVDDVAAFHQCVIRYQAQLRATSVYTSTPSMLLVRHSSTVAFALAQPTVATLTALAQHFFSTKTPFDLPSGVDEVGDDINTLGLTDVPTTGPLNGQHSSNGEEPQHASKRGVSFSAWAKAVCALGVTELTVAFPASTPDTLMWYWVARVLFMAVLRRARYVVRQLIGR